MSSKSMMPKLAISALCLSLLSACGGDDGPSMFDDSETGKPGFTGTDKSKIQLPPVDRISRTPLIHHFVATGNNGQQLSPTAVMNDDNGNGRIDSTDRPHFRSPGIVSSILVAGEEGSEFYKDQRDRAEELQENIKTAQETVEQDKVALAEAQKALIKAQKEAKNKKTAAGSTDKKEGENSVEAAKEKLEEAKAKLDKSINELGAATTKFNNSNLPIHNTKDGRILMEDVNGQYYTVSFHRTIDINNLPNNYPDAGTVKIDVQRTRNPDGRPVDTPRGGSTGREFNRVILFGKDESKYNFNKGQGTHSVDRKAYLDAYFRHPAAAGWTYQTFGNFHSNTLAAKRDLNVGYQSIGIPTKTGELPKDGYAVYNGIAHAYYNTDQVTMHNEINANFSKRRLTYKTTESAMYHTFEGPGGEGTVGNTHVVEFRPDLNLTGEARWDKGVSQFTGKIATANGLEGKIEGRFYGPQAAEVGGVFGLQGTVKNQVIQYVGGFGASRD